jgi:glycine/D-amino acid oxidase-like deaminating enzyme/nitrite reductase/ring-hydroxylating ferredoxin subunit
VPCTKQTREFDQKPNAPRHSERNSTLEDIMAPETTSLKRRKIKSAPQRSHYSKGNVSFWSATTQELPAHSLENKTAADVCVVGAGIAGLTTAYLLTREGKSVIVLDKNQIGRGETANTTAHLSNVVDASYREIEKVHGPKGAQLAAHSHTSAITTIESIVADEGIDCDFERLDGFLLLAGEESQEDIEQEWHAALRAGLLVEKVKQWPFDFEFGPCLRFPQQAQFHPLKYLAGLARAIERAGGRLFSETEAKEIKGGKTAKIKTNHRATIFAEAIVVATNTPVNDWVKIHTKQAAYRTYAIGATIAADSMPKALFWDTEDPFHYVRVQRLHGKAQDLLIVGGEDHKTGQDQGIEDRFERLITWARAHFPVIEDVRYRWSGQVIESMDGLAFIGRNPGDEPNVYIVTGDSGNGLTHGTIAGMLLRDLILGRENPWGTLYDPSRKTLRAAAEFARENLNVVAEYAQWVTPGEVDTADQIPAGTGAIVRRGLSKIAVFRDQAGKLHERSAVCPHLGCIVAWNSTEQSWDCPCHGSRFDTHGKVLNGPAIGPLEASPPHERSGVAAKH